jgi:tetratricopeptide (TPR) repeat protein
MLAQTVATEEFRSVDELPETDLTAPAPDSVPARGSGGAPFELARGAEVGRYVVLHRLGAGGMGVVYAAYDHELDRKVALKLLNPRDEGSQGKAARVRMLREAQAMARLTHGNVVTVHDVGTVDGRLFLAMEFIDGLTCGAWLKQRARSTAEVLEMFAQAGRGLAAAHAAGLVHRDFKPENVMVGLDGRVLVLDFGLARAVAGDPVLDTVEEDDDARDPGREPLSQTTGTNALSVELTVAGAVMGTPAYMSPEQLQGGTVDHRSDQFSFCVSLFEGLYGVRPFQGENTIEYAAAVTEGRMRELPTGRNVPTHIRRALLKGLEVGAARRHPSMSALLEELSRDPRARVRRFGYAAGTVVVLGAAAFWIAEANSGPAMCQDSAAGLAGAWDAERRAEVQRVFASIDRPYARDAFEGVDILLEQYTTQWATTHRDACEATHVRGEQSPRILDLRMGCLDRRRAELSALVETLADADAQVVARSAEAVSGLGSISRCSDLDALQSTVEPPADAQTRQRVEALRAEMTAGQAALAAGKYAEGVELMTPIVAEAKTLAWRPLEGQALLLFGKLQAKAGQPKPGANSLESAVESALAGGDDRTLAAALAALVHVAGNRNAQFESGHRFARLSRAANERLGDDAGLEAERMQGVGSLLYAEGRYAEALEAFNNAAALLESTVGDKHLRVARAYDSSGNALYMLARYEQADRDYRRALTIYEGLLGPSHPTIASSRSHIAGVFAGRGEFAEALTAYREALGIAQRALGEDHLEVAHHLGNVSLMQLYSGDYAAALESSERAYAIRRKQHGESDHPELADSLAELASIHYYLGETQKTLDLGEQALAMRERLLGPEHPEVANALDQVSAGYWAAGDYETTARLTRRALAIREHALGPEHADVARNLDNLAGTLTKLDRRDEAIVLHRRSLAIGEKLYGSEHHELVVPLTGIGTNLMAKGKTRAAYDSLARALEISDKTQPPPGVEWPARLAAGRCMLALDRPAEAEVPLERAIALLGSEPAFADSLTEARRELDKTQAAIRRQ